ncbi:hypothetical protein [Alloprevotella sp. OH1205_COT-284]|uniref:type IX secretion system protein PorG n=1 Tax=Alloprevotella sp. OH1205_COT-284 TaxID=2491043 RepID=UPI001F2B9310|nr:hypothetical protein [Alloprevotella sp. OH1205_COT-284]
MEKGETHLFLNKPTQKHGRTADDDPTTDDSGRLCREDPTNRSVFMKPLLSLCICISALMIGIALPLRAQDEEYYTKEIGGTLGTNFMLNDVNSSFYGGSNFSGGALLRFVLNPRMAVKTMLTYNFTRGDASTMKGFYPSQFDQITTDRVAHRFDGGWADLSTVYEVHFLPYGYHRGYQGYRRLVPFMQFGLGLTYGDIGKAFTPNVPIGFGLKYKLRPRLNLALDWTFHFTLSDRLEGLAYPAGIKSDMFRNKDHYGQTMITLTYDFSPRCPACHKAE